MMTLCRVVQCHGLQPRGRYARRKAMDHAAVVADAAGAPAAGRAPAGSAADRLGCGSARPGEIPEWAGRDDAVLRGGLPPTRPAC